MAALSERLARKSRLPKFQSVQLTLQVSRSLGAQRVLGGVVTRCMRQGGT